MKNFHPLYIVGTIGTIVTDFLHIFFALVLTLNTLHSTFIALYAAYTVLMCIGVRLSAMKFKGQPQ